MKLRVYISCALTYATPEYKQMIFAFKDALKEIPWIEVLSFITTNTQQPEPDTRHIYCNDIHDCVGKAHVLISEVSIPSTGLGWEMGTAIEKHDTPIFMCAKKDAVVSNLLIGASVHHEMNMRFWRYEHSIMDLFDRFVEELKVLHSNQ